jgi:mono/diheme cytochrome c family protein
MQRLILWLSICLMLPYSIVSMADDDSSGAQLFSERCVLCHGAQGMGEGPLALNIDDYPSTNLIEHINAQGYEELNKVITNGSSNNPYMPPWKDELSSTEIDAVTQFVMLLRENSERALAQLHALEEQRQSSIADGKLIYSNRCVLCHGVTGIGDGRMSKVVKNPPPFNLTLSVLQKDAVVEIISEGGQGTGRSPQMPPWKDQLSTAEIEAVTAYIMTLRQH